MHFLKKIAFVAFFTPFVFIQADVEEVIVTANKKVCLLYTSPSPRDGNVSRMPSSA